MATTTSKRTLWIEPTGGGLNQKVKGTALRSQEVKSYQNMTHDKIGVWRSRKGMRLAGTVSGVGGVQAIASYKQKNGVCILVMVAGGNLYTWNNVDSFNLSVSSVVNSLAEVNLVNYLDRLYIFSSNPGDYLKYYDGSTVTLVGGETNKINPKYGTVAQNTLWISGIPSLEDRIYASLYDITAVAPTDRFYNDGETMSNSTRYFSLNGEMVTGLASFKNYANAFTDYSVYSMDIRSLGQIAGLSKTLDVGCASQKSIAVDNKFAVSMWNNRKEGAFLWTAGGDPTNVGDFLIERGRQEGFIDLIDPNNFRNIAGAIWDGKYYMSVGDLTDSTLENYQNMVFVYDIAANKWGARNYDAGCFCTHIDVQGEQKLFAGSRTSRTVFILEENKPPKNQTLDIDKNGNNLSFTSYVRTKDFQTEFGSAQNQKTFHSIYVVYTGSARVTVSYSLNGTDIYTPLTELPIPEVQDVDSRIARFIELPLGKQGKSISLEFRKEADTMEIQAFGFEYSLHPTMALRPN